MKLRLQQSLVSSIEIDGVDYPLHSAFNNVLKVIDVLDDPFISHDFIRIDTALMLLIGDTLDEYETIDKADILAGILKEYFEVEKKVEYDIMGNEITFDSKSEEEVAKPKMYDYNEDAELIYSAFMQAYGIDLIDEQDNMHWLKFRALFNSLPRETEFMQIVSIRGWNEGEEKKPYEEKMRRLRQKYSLR